MHTKPFLSLILLLAASASVFLSTSAAAADLVPDARAHRACLERIQTLSRSENLALRAGPTYVAPRPAAGRYRYYVNARSAAPTADHREYRIECEARQIGRVTRFTLEPGSWSYNTTGSQELAAN